MSNSDGTGISRMNRDAVVSKLELLYSERGVRTFIVGFAFSSNVFNDFPAAGLYARRAPMRLSG